MSISMSELTKLLSSDVLQKNLAKEIKAGSEVKVEMASGCRNINKKYFTNPE